MNQKNILEFETLKRYEDVIIQDIGVENLNIIDVDEDGAETIQDVVINTYSTVKIFNKNTSTLIFYVKVPTFEKWQTLVYDINGNIERFKTVNEAVDYMESYIIVSKFNENEKTLDFSDFEITTNQQEIDDTILSLSTQITKYNSNKNI